MAGRVVEDGDSSVPLRDKTARKSVKTRDIDLPLRADEPRFHNADTIKLGLRTRAAACSLSFSFFLSFRYRRSIAPSLHIRNDEGPRCISLHARLVRDIRVARLKSSAKFAPLQLIALVIPPPTLSPDDGYARTIRGVKQRGWYNALSKGELQVSVSEDK